jgi:hypothetical protein
MKSPFVHISNDKSFDWHLDNQNPFSYHCCMHARVL